MLDWSEIVRRRLSSLGLEAPREREIVAELSTHLEEVYEEGRHRGASSREAADWALAQVSDWNNLRREICNAERGEDAMNQRTKSLWLPGMITLTLSMLWLMPLEWLDIQGRFLWMKTIYITRDSIYLTVYWPWLALLPPIGALGAYWSWRAGGGATQRVLSSVFPSLAFAAVFALALIVSLFVENLDLLRFHLKAFGLVSLNWIIVPGVALVLGALPFLRGTKVQSAREFTAA